MNYCARAEQSLSYSISKPKYILNRLRIVLLNQDNLNTFLLINVENDVSFNYKNSNFYT